MNITEYLLSKGADTAIKNKLGYTAGDLVSSNRTDILELLVNKQRQGTT